MRMFFTFLLSICVFSLNAQQIYTIAGNGTAGFSGDGIAATSSSLNQPFGVAVDTLGNVYIADRANNRVRKVDAAGIVTTIAGNGAGGYSGDDRAATAASIFDITGVATDGAGNVYIADKSNNRIRKVDKWGIISTIAGTGVAGYNTDGLPATNAQLNNPRGVATDRYGNVYIADQANGRVRKIDTSGYIHTIAGDGIPGFNGDGGPATLARLQNPYAIAVDDIGNIYVSDVDNERIRLIDTSGIISTYAGNGIAGYGGDGGPATGASLDEPIGVAADKYGTIYIADGWNNRVRAVNAEGVISTVAGTGTAGFLGDGGPALSAECDHPYGVAVSSAGLIYFSDNGNNRVRSLPLPTLVHNVIHVQDITIFPNPSGGNYFINVTSNATTLLTLTIANTLGQKVYETVGQTNTPINVSLNVRPGIYTIKLIYADDILFRKIEID